MDFMAFSNYVRADGAKAKHLCARSPILEFAREKLIPQQIAFLALFPHYPVRCAAG
jgi:hypothetical protein